MFCFCFGIIFLFSAAKFNQVRSRDSEEDSWNYGAWRGMNRAEHGRAAESSLFNNLLDWEL